MKRTALMFSVVLAAALAPAAPPAELVLIGGRIYPAPGAPPILYGAVVVRDRRIAAGPSDRVAIPAGAERLDCAGASVAAGFWNCHVHFTEPKWEEAGGAPAARLEEQLQEMLTRYGFTTVVDTGSLLENTLALRRRIEAGECRGPRIFTTGPGFVARGGSPYYIKPVLLPEIETPEQAAAAAPEGLAITGWSMGAAFCGDSSPRPSGSGARASGGEMSWATACRTVTGPVRGADDTSNRPPPSAAATIATTPRIIAVRFMGAPRVATLPGERRLRKARSRGRGIGPHGRTCAIRRRARRPCSAQEWRHWSEA